MREKEGRTVRAEEVREDEKRDVMHKGKQLREDDDAGGEFTRNGKVQNGGTQRVSILREIASYPS